MSKAINPFIAFFALGMSDCTLYDKNVRVAWALTLFGISLQSKYHDDSHAGRTNKNNNGKVIFATKDRKNQTD